MNTLEILGQFFQIVDSIYGVYLDATTGFELNRKRIIETQNSTAEDFQTRFPELASIEYLDSTAMIYGKGDPNDPTSVTLHSCTQAEYKARNERGGNNFRFVASVCLVTIYQYWEDFFREEIAKSLGITKNEITSDIMGDIRSLRISIIHNRGFAIAEVEKCRILKWFKRGDPVFLNEDQFETIIVEIKKFIIDCAKSLEGKVDASR